MRVPVTEKYVCYFELYQIADADSIVTVVVKLYSFSKITKIVQQAEVTGGSLVKFTGIYINYGHTSCSFQVSLCVLL